ncbi:MAG: hypothetical protein KDE19_03640, partial [Caldilineaceae bacterium]|nr:hypothetical protein [Caldilineaceae bacterium]
MHIRPLPLLTTLLVLGALLWTFAVYTTTAMAGTDGVSLAFGTDLQVNVGETITVPLQFVSAGNAVSSATFSINFDQRCLRFDDGDENGDGIPDAI